MTGADLHMLLALIPWRHLVAKILIFAEILGFDSPNFAIFLESALKSLLKW